jgi:hypothetical protein
MGINVSGIARFGFAFRGALSDDVLHLAGFSSDRAAGCQAAMRNVVRRGPILIGRGPEGEDISIENAGNVADQPDDGGWAMASQAVGVAGPAVTQGTPVRIEEVAGSSSGDIDLDAMSERDVERGRESGGSVSGEGGQVQASSYAGCTVTAKALAFTSCDGCHNVACAHSSVKHFFAAYQTATVIQRKTLALFAEIDGTEAKRQAVDLHRRVLRHTQQVCDFVTAVARGGDAPVPDDDMSLCMAEGPWASRASSRRFCRVWSMPSGRTYVGHRRFGV